MQLNGQKLKGLSEKFSYKSQLLLFFLFFLGKNAKYAFSIKKMVLGEVLYQI